MQRRSSVLVTGGAGFIGSHLCDRLLRDGWRVTAVDDLSQGRPSNLVDAVRGGEFDFIATDVRSVAHLRAAFSNARPDVVMHLADAPGVRTSVEDPAHDAAVNIIGLIRVLEASTEFGVRRVVVAGSAGTIYGNLRQLPAAEGRRRASLPLSPHGISKKTAEDYLRFFRAARGLGFTMLAIGNAYGPRQDPYGDSGVVAIFARSMLARQPPTIYGDGLQTRDFVYVDDVVEAFCRAAAVPEAEGRVVNIGTGVETSVVHVCTLLQELTGFAAAPYRRPPPKGEVRRIALDPSGARALLGWIPATPLPEGLRRVVQHLRSTEPAGPGVQADVDLTLEEERPVRPVPNGPSGGPSRRI